MKKCMSFFLAALIIFSIPGCGSKKKTYDKLEWPDSELASMLPVPKSTKGEIGFDLPNALSIDVVCTSVEEFAAYADACKERGFTEDVDDTLDTMYCAYNADGYRLILMLDDNVMWISLATQREDEPSEAPIESESIDVSQIPEPIEEPSATPTPEPEPTPTPTLEPTQEPTSEPTSEHTPTPSPTAKPLTYSTNTLSEAKKGNTGVFSYIKRGPNYDIYWIIDFDEGYAYSFTYGNGDTDCDRVKIDEGGTLNEYITVTYHDGDDTWQYGLCFKRKNQPDRLIQSDTRGNQDEFTSTELDDALNIRDRLIIVDY